METTSAPSFEIINPIIGITTYKKFRNSTLI